MLTSVCVIVAGCATTSDVCNVRYFRPSSHDTEGTKRQALAQNEFLKSQGCPDDGRSAPGGVGYGVSPEAPQQPSGFAKLFGGFGLK